MATCTRTLLKGQLLSVIIFCPTDAWPLFVLEDSLFPTRRRGYFPCIYTASLASLLAAHRALLNMTTRKTKNINFLISDPRNWNSGVTVPNSCTSFFFFLFFFNSFIVATFKHNISKAKMSFNLVALKSFRFRLRQKEEAYLCIY